MSPWCVIALLGLSSLFPARETLAQPLAIPADIGVTMTATPSTGLHTGQAIDIAITATNYGPQAADHLELSSAYYWNEYAITQIDAVACYQFAGAIGEGPGHPWYIDSWIIAGVPDTGMQPFAVGESRTCHFQLTLMAAAPAVTAYTFGVPTFFSDINPANNVATVYLQRALAAVPIFGRSSIFLLVALVTLAGAWRLVNTRARHTLANYSLKRTAVMGARAIMRCAAAAA
jgi:hypothetical protein